LSRSHAGEQRVGSKDYFVTAAQTMPVKRSRRSQFERRQLFQHKFVTFRTLEINNCKRDCMCVQSLLRPPLQPTGNSFSADDFATYTRKKISAIRDKTAAAAAGHSVLFVSFPLFFLACHSSRNLIYPRHVQLNLHF
jgi:hypothetical protein